jgi:hypothetical protein
LIRPIFFRHNHLEVGKPVQVKIAFPLEIKNLPKEKKKIMSTSLDSLKALGGSYKAKDLMQKIRLKKSFVLMAEI